MKKLTFLFIALTSLTAFPQQFKVSYSSSDYNGPFTGNVFLFLNRHNKNAKDVELGMELFPCYSVFVKNVKPGNTITINDKAACYPVKLSDLERGEYFVQAVWDRNMGGRSVANSAGNIYSQAEKFRLSRKTKKIISIKCDREIPIPVFIETESIKELRVPSELLTSFYHRSLTIDAAVSLPEEYNIEPHRKFPVLIDVFGYGSDYHNLSGSKDSPMPAVDTISFIRVFLDGNCPLGHSVYANSENNGPWGDALVKEFIPELEKEYRCNGGRLITGHSSGGWSSLWLQTHYPSVFAGCWSSSPDPVDFRSFQEVNLYTDRNMFYNDNGELRCLSTIGGGIPWLYMKDMYGMEDVIYRGEQMHSFEAVFSKKDINGKPERLCNTETGEIDTVTVSHWKAYDISLYLRKNWDNIKKDLDGKVRISVGEQDNFLLNYAVYLLEDEM